MNITISAFHPLREPDEAPLTPNEVRAAVKKSLNLSLTPEPIPQTRLHRQISLYLTTALAAEIESVRHRHPNLSMAETIAGLALAFWRTLPNDPPGTQAKLPNSPESNLREAIQARMSAAIDAAVAAQGIALIEGGTGTGKSRVMGKAAIQLGAQGKRSLMVAPTLETMTHLAEELRLCDGHNDVSHVLLPGRGNFVDGNRLLGHLDGLETEEPESLSPRMIASHDRVREWLNAGGAPISPSARRLQDAMPDTQLRYLCDDALFLAPHLSIQSIRLLDLEDNPWSSVVTDLAVASREALIVITTHAMLAVHVRRGLITKRWDLLGGWDLLLIDEAHELENSFASSLSDFISLHAASRLLDKLELWRAMRLGTAAETAQEFLKSLANRLAPMANSRRKQDQIADARLFSGAQAAFQPFAEAKYTRGKTAEQQSALREAKRIGGVFRQAEFASYPASIAFSPIRKYLRITVGPRSVRRDLTELWEQTPSAALLSATLLLPDSIGRFTPDFILEKLALTPQIQVPGKAISEGKPFRDRLLPTCKATPEWLLTTPTLHLPRKGSDWPCYPQSSSKQYDEESLDAAVGHWQASMGKILTDQILSTAIGGTLVLTTSYADIAAFEELLASDPAIGNRLFAAKRNQSFSSLKARYIQAYRDGQRPVLIALGPAWTGFDLRDPLAEDATADTLLTDLVIPRLPFNSVDSSVAQHRKRKHGPSADTAETLLRLRQGLGRLVRRPGLQDRNIWFLDGRIFIRQRMGAFRSLLHSYPNRKEIDPS